MKIKPFILNFLSINNNHLKFYPYVYNYQLESNIRIKKNASNQLAIFLSGTQNTDADYDPTRDESTDR